MFYGYDAAGRLNAEQRQSTSTLTAGGTIQNTTRTLWAYDKVGNRLTQAVSNYDGIGTDAPSVLKSTFNTAYSYNNNDWLLSTTSIRNDGTGESTFVTNFEYNANGSQSAVTSNVGKPEEHRTPYYYDFEQKLIAIGNATDPINHTYAYDADGNRIAESNSNAENTTIRHYLVDPNNSNAQIVEEYDNANALQAHYDWNDAELLRIAALNADKSTFTIHEPLADAHNNIRQLINSTGTISDVYAFDAWGNPQVSIGNATNPYRYNSQKLDASGLYYLRARQYASGLGRFISHDPMMGTMQNPITQHRYLYAGDDAVNAMDPSGQATLFGLNASMSIQMTLASGLTGAAGAGWDAALSGGTSIDVVQSASIGFVMGAALGYAGSIPVMQVPVGVIGIGFSVQGMRGAYQAYQQGNTVLAIYRGAASTAGLIGSGYLISSRLTALNTVIPRTERDININMSKPTPTQANDGVGYIGKDVAQIAELNTDIAYARGMNASDIRVNQQQVNADLVRVGINRPDLQYTLNGKRYYIEYDTIPAYRSKPHGQRIRSNDPDGKIILKVFPKD